MGWLAVIAAVVDVIANYTELALYTMDFPRKGELTFSQRLYRLQGIPDWRGAVANKVIPILNYFDPSGVHVQPL